MSIKVICIIILATIAYIRCECSSESLRQFAIDACHITKRSAHFKSSYFKNEGYDVEHVIPKYHNRHSKPMHAKKLTRSNFPSGAYLLLHPISMREISYENNDIYDELSDNDTVDDDYMANEILTIDMNKNHNKHHKHRHIFRSKRNTAADTLIEHCCSQATADVCGKYFCH